MVDVRFERRHVGLDKPADNRVGAQRDRDRVLYSSAFRRLAGVTQVVAASEGHVFHNRLTHTLKVAQVARRIAEMLVRPWEQGEEPDRPPPLIDPDVVETAALVHDLGHPPFGHVAEKHLHALMRGAPAAHAIDPQQPDPEDATRRFDPWDGFEGNAQSFRIVTKLASADFRFQGLNLARATLAATLKYPYFHDPTDQDLGSFKKWSAYRTEEDDLRFALALDEAAVIPGCQTAQTTLEADIMDWADDITYAVHDAEDFYRAGLVPLDRLKLLEGDREDFAQWVHDRWNGQWRKAPIAEDEILAAVNILRTLFVSGRPYEGTRHQRVAVRSFVSSLVGRYVSVSGLVPDGHGDYRLEMPRGFRLEVDVLKELTWRYVIERPALAAQQQGQLRVVEDLFHIFIEAMEGHRNKRLLPIRAREHLEHQEDTPTLRGRIACDVICSLTEQESHRLHRRLTGLDLGSVVDPVVIR